jgi:NADH-quinone oxidoreductase subunit C
MPDETKPNPPAPEAAKPAETKPAETTPAAAKVVEAKAIATPPAAAAKPPAPSAPAKPAGPTPQPWNNELTARLKSRYGTGIRDALTYLGQDYLVVDRSLAYEILEILCTEEKFNYCVDITAVHYPKKEEQFEVIWILYSFEKNVRMRVKTLLPDGADIPSVFPLWPTADWLEREVFDMFGIKFIGHPGLKRILLPDEWKGYPLRKDYGILQQDQEWVQINLGIESGQ